MPQHNCFVFECEKMVCFLVYLCLQCFLLLHKSWHNLQLCDDNKLLFGNQNGDRVPGRN